MKSAQTRFSSVKRLLSGFTMIELLIVIAILGVLAVAVLSAINPLEQINRGRDTGSQSDAEQLITAFDRYQAIQEIYPWQATSASSAIISALKNVDNLWVDGAATPVAVLSKLQGATEELKAGFVNRLNGANYNKLSVYYRGTPGDSVYACWVNKSNAFNQKAVTRCGGTSGAGLPTDLTAIASTLCTPLTGSTKVYTCLP